jgi:hypothetical protein
MGFYITVSHPIGILLAEILFENKESNMKMYYTGNDYQGHGMFWIYKNSQKEIILETNIRYGPAIFGIMELSPR